MISNERLGEILSALCSDSMDDYEQVFDSIKNGEIGDMAKELLALRKAFSEPVAWEYVEKQDCNIGEPIHLYKLSEERPEPHFNVFEVEALYRKPTDSTT